MKFEFKCVDDSGTEVTYRFEDVYLPTVLDHVRSFLQAAGFQIKNNLEECADVYEEVGFPSDSRDICVCRRCLPGKVHCGEDENDYT